ncbi:MAG: chromosome segregation protein SMC [Phycisphaerae bacterium]
MRLAKLIVQGFKSFADRVEFTFDAPITGIVGPNGCGKSNVVDAVKWVLGAQSAKSLRGDAMMDVIFNGSAGRKPGGMAEVQLVFENPLRGDAGRLLQYDADEVAVGRRLYRDGTSDYIINGRSARLKDVRDIFLDTGVGVDVYSIIEQGKVSAMLEASSTDRRLIFEEAAGISRFKARKKEAQRKLERTDQNLLRVNDIVEEVEKRLRSVKVQAGRARTYQELSTRLNALRLRYALHEYGLLHTKLAEQEKQQEERRFELDDVAADLQHSQNELAEQRTHADDRSGQRQRAEHELVQARAALENARSRQSWAQKQIEQVQEQQASLQADLQAAQAKRAAAAEALTGEEAQAEALTKQVAEGQAAISQKNEAYRALQLELNQSNQQIEREKSAALELMRKLAQTNSRLGAIEIEKRNVAGQQKRLVDRRHSVLNDHVQAEQKRNQLTEQLSQKQAELAELGRRTAAKREAAAELEGQVRQTTEKLVAAREERSGLVSRRKMLEDLEARRDGIAKGVQEVLKRREAFGFVRGLVADVLRVDVEHAKVVEAALDGRDQWLVATDMDAVVAARDELAKLPGRVQILNVRSMGFQPSRLKTDGLEAHATPVRLAADLVRAAPEDRPLVEMLLGDTLVVPTLADAVKMQSSMGFQPNSKETDGLEAHATGLRFVTNTGEVLEADGTVKAGPLGAAMGLISRRSELQSVKQHMADVDGQIEALSGEVAAGAQAARALDAELTELRNASYATNTVKVELTSKISGLEDQIAGYQRELPVLDRELATLWDQGGKLKEEGQTLAERQGEFEQQQAQREQAVKDLQQQATQNAERVKKLAEALADARVTLGTVQEKQIQARRAVERHQAQVAELAEQIQRLANAQTEAAGRVEKAGRELAAARHDEEQQDLRQKELADRVHVLGEQLEALRKVVRELAQTVDARRERHDTLKSELNKLDVSVGELRVRLETLVSRTAEELELDLPAIYRGEDGTLKGGALKVVSIEDAITDAVLPPLRDARWSVAAADTAAEAAEPVVSVPPPEEGEAPDWDAIAEEIKDLRGRIQRLGNVNLDAIADQEEFETHQQDMAAQLADLVEAKKQLEELIDEINRESSIRFEQTFNAVREHFGLMFRKLFGGGKADIVLETEIQDKKAVGADATDTLPVMKRIDPLEAGIEIIARPPGKQPATISQLSGGEKTMTCIALLMSIFKSKPSPFCILDEVDAALDEANNRRFNMIVQEFLEMSQFIIITHSKPTMQIADVLYGVTMQEQGVSKRVKVNFEDVGKDGRIERVAEEYVAA